MLIETLMGPRGARLLADVMTVGAIVTFLYGLVKLAYQRVTGRALPRSVVTNVLDVAVEVFANIWGMLNRAGRLQGLPSIFAPPAPPSDTVPPRPEAPAPIPPASDGQRGAVRVGALLVISGAVILATLAGAAVYGCREPSNCDRRVDSWRCSPAGRPERCAEGNVWRSHYYGPCSLSRQRCVVLVGAATCLPIVDASTQPITTDAAAPDAE